MKQITLPSTIFTDQLIEWLTINISPLKDPGNRLNGLTWSIYWYLAPNVSGIGFGNHEMEISFENDDDATLFSLSFLCSQ